MWVGYVLTNGIKSCSMFSSKVGDPMLMKYLLNTVAAGLAWAGMTHRINENGFLFLIDFMVFPS